MQEKFAADQRPSWRRSAIRLDDRVVENMLAGYALVEALVADGHRRFAMGQLKHLLELNTLVLCGTDEARRDDYARHLGATERRFYEERGGGIQRRGRVARAHTGRPARGAGRPASTCGCCSKPQLFIEGNHRTGALLMSYVLLRDGEAALRADARQRRRVLRGIDGPSKHRPPRAGRAPAPARPAPARGRAHLAARRRPLPPALTRRGVA